MDSFNQNRFQIINNIKKFIIGLEKIILTIPKKDIITRNMIYNDALILLELVFEANYEKDLNLRHQFQIEALAKISKIDFYLERAYKLKYISEKQVTKKADELLNINKMLYAWCYHES